MEFRKLPSNSRQLLFEIVHADNAVQLLCDKFEKSTSKENDELSGILRELRKAEYVTVKWADDKPYQVIVNNAGRMYEERLAEYEAEHAASEKTTYYANSITNNSVQIGDGNIIKNSTIGNSIQNQKEDQPSFFKNHPLFTGIVTAVIAGAVLMFSFWQDIIKWIEELF